MTMTSERQARTGILTGPLLAVSFLTILPVRLRYPVAEGAAGRAVAYFPLVGALLGAVVAGADTLFRVVLPVGVASALDIALLAVFTGGLHLDGFVDSCDGLLGGRNPERRLEIMRDSRAGSFGAAGLTFLLLIQYTALSNVHGIWRPAGLIVLCVLSRWAMVLALALFPYARAAGLGSPFHDALSRVSVAVAGVLALLIGAALLARDPVALLGMVVASALVALGGGWWIQGRLGGLTGDSYGAIEQMSWTLMLLVLVARHG